MKERQPEYEKRRSINEKGIPDYVFCVFSSFPDYYAISTTITTIVRKLYNVCVILVMRSVVLKPVFIVAGILKCINVCVCMTTSKRNNECP